MYYDECKNEQDKSETKLSDKIADNIQEHPKEAEACIGCLILGGLGLVIEVFIQWVKRKKEEKLHHEVERLAQEAIQKQDAEIKDLSEKAKDAENLGTVNEALVKALESEKNKGGELDEEE